MAKRSLDEVDHKLLALLRTRGRMPTAELGRQLGLSRSAVQERMKRLERDGIILGYTVILGSRAANTTDNEKSAVSAHVFLTIDQKQQERAISALKGLPEIDAVYSVAGAYDAIAIVTTTSAVHLDDVLTRIGKLAGVNRTTSAVLLSTLLEKAQTRRNPE